MAHWRRWFGWRLAGKGGWDVPSDALDARNLGVVLPKEIAEKLKKHIEGDVVVVVGAPFDIGGRNVADAKKLEDAVKEFVAKHEATVTDLAAERRRRRDAEERLKELERGPGEVLNEIGRILGIPRNASVIVAAQSLKDKLRDYADVIDRLEDEAVKVARKPAATLRGKVLSVVEESKTLSGYSFAAATCRTVDHVRACFADDGSSFVVAFDAAPSTLHVGDAVTLEIVR